MRLEKAENFQYSTLKIMYGGINVCTLILMANYQNIHVCVHVPCLFSQGLSTTFQVASSWIVIIKR